MVDLIQYKTQEMFEIRASMQIFEFELMEFAGSPNVFCILRISVRSLNRSQRYCKRIFNDDSLYLSYNIIRYMLVLCTRLQD